LELVFFAMGENHREDFAVSSPEMVLAAVASLTKNIKLASDVKVLSSSEPVKVYEYFATLDVISDGRAKDGALFIGNSEEVADNILYANEISWLTRFISHMDIGAPNHDGFLTKPQSNSLVPHLLQYSAKPEFFLSVLRHGK
jgi:hypothetical protein